jgi:hypothetical protein
VEGGGVGKHATFESTFEVHIGLLDKILQNKNVRKKCQKVRKINENFKIMP